MSKQRYPGFRDAKARFERVRPAVAEIDAMMRSVKPFGPDYCVLLAAREAITTAAFHFTREPFMYGSAGTSSTGLMKCATTTD